MFAGAEIAIVSIRRTRLQQLVEDKRRGAEALAALRSRPEHFLATVQVGITVVGATAAAFGGATMAGHLEPLLAPLPYDRARGPRRSRWPSSSCWSRTCRWCWASWCPSRWPCGPPSPTPC